ncbi:rhodanese-like domain-containing protein [Planococcus lenghuensis]|uniref:Rhodanese n=1 Tax=Planococcus lenghuensis TaxID=2213202 RepID=A0A1Q2L470_9BACL|nr:rhodanese-like domain-containing protein [Planococcus lenghuensis]AQQ54662.1 rhodanese [Planococcus lenghuensis]
MEIISWLAIGALAVWLVYKVIGPAKGISSVTPDEVKPMLKTKDKQFIDVRTWGEYRMNGLKAFKNIPLNELPKRLDELDSGKETVVICQSGARSNRACVILKKNGFSQVTNIRGGMGAWR